MQQGTALTAYRGRCYFIYADNAVINFVARATDLVNVHVSSFPVGPVDGYDDSYLINNNANAKSDNQIRVILLKA